MRRVARSMAQPPCRPTARSIAGSSRSSAIRKTPLEPCDWSLVAELDGRVVGYVAVTGNHIESLYIMPDAQGQGVGRALLAAVEHRLTGPVTLRCLTANGRARSLYERCGFAVSREEEIRYHGRPLVAWLMVKAR